jgi:hypothetical protein
MKTITIKAKRFFKKGVRNPVIAPFYERHPKLKQLKHDGLIALVSFIAGLIVLITYFFFTTYKIWIQSPIVIEKII